MANALNDGLNAPDQLDDEAIQSTEIGSGGVLASNISGGQVNSTHQDFVATGSPSAFGNSVQMQEFVANAGSVAVVQFGTAFSAAPVVVAQVVGGISSHPATSAGSAVIECETASASGTLVAIGSGNI